MIIMVGMVLSMEIIIMAVTSTNSFYFVPNAIA